jgi:peptidoglycan/LPS O-acetylase OafA/YrhL
MKRLQTAIVIWVVLQVLCVRLPIDVPGLSGGYYFLAAGAVLAMIYQGRNLRLNYAMLAVSLILCLYSSYHYAGQVHINPWICGAAVAALFAMFLALGSRNVRLPFAKRIGSVTYPIYLLHFHIGVEVIHWIGSSANQWVLLPMLIVAIVAASWVIDDVIEFRLRTLWFRLVRGALANPVWARAPWSRGL